MSMRSAMSPRATAAVGVASWADAGLVKNSGDRAAVASRARRVGMAIPPVSGIRWLDGAGQALSVSRFRDTGYDRLTAVLGSVRRPRDATTAGRHAAAGVGCQVPCV